MTPKLDTAATFERIGSLYGKLFGPLIGAAALTFIPVALLEGLIFQSGSLSLLLVTTVIAVAAQALYAGVVVKAVEDMRDGRRDLGLGELFSAAVPSIWPLVGGGILFGILLVVGLILLVVPGLVFLTWYCLYPAIVVIERERVFAAFTRSRDLVRGNGWRVFGIVLVTIIITSVIANVLQRIGHDVSDGFVGAAIGSFVGGLITAPVFAITVSVLYFDLRDLKEPGGAPATARPGPAAPPPPAGGFPPPPR
jgi:hypothetical protein